MRIALVHPTYWPEVRRGSERFIHDLAAHLAARGHAVTVLTGHRGRRRVSSEDGFTVVRGRRPSPRLRPRGMEAYAEHAPSALAAVASRRFDVVHALHIPDAWAAAWATRPRRTPMVLSLMGYPDAETLDAFRHRRAMLAGAAGAARRVHVLSAAAGEALHAASGIRATPVHPGTDVAAFDAGGPRDEVPTIFCAASPSDPRKRVPMLVEAFGRLRRQREDARLILDRGPAAEDPGLRAPGVGFVDAREEGLASLYARAWATVLPSAREAFGLVLVESLAAGTPAVGMAEGGMPEILDDPGVGLLSGPGPGELARALAGALDLAREDGIRARCREHAARWDWGVQVERFEELYEEAAGGRP